MHVGFTTIIENFIFYLKSYFDGYRSLHRYILHSKAYQKPFSKAYHVRELSWGGPLSLQYEKKLGGRTQKGRK